MITQALRLAHRLDSWLDRQLGPPYRVLLAIGLVVEIVRHLRELAHVPDELALLRILPVLLDLALLLHTADALHERWERRLAHTSRH